MCERSVRISVKIRDLSGKKSSQGKLPKNFPKKFINKLFSITHLVICADYFMVFIAECCLLCFIFYYLYSFLCYILVVV